MKIVTIIGARPQFIKASVVSRAMTRIGCLQEVIVHTGQHFDSTMSDIFFRQLGIPTPNYQLGINGGNHGEMTGRMLTEIESVLLTQKPDRVLVYGDTNSTLAGALAAAKLHVPVAHVEAGLRSFNMKMPEEVNRVLTDHVSDLLFCPTQAAINNLIRDGFAEKPVDMLDVGDVMQDSAMMFKEFAIPPDGFDFQPGFILATLHRAENTEDLTRLDAIVNALNKVHSTIAAVVMPLHPRTRDAIKKAGFILRVNVIEPVGYLEMIWLLRHCGLVLTDSGGLQKEAFFFGKASVTMRDQTEWVELVDIGANELVSADAKKIIAAVTRHIGRAVDDEHQLYGGGKAVGRIVERLAKEAC